MSKHLIIFFVNIVINLGVVFDEGLLGKSAALDDSIAKITECYKAHPSIRLTKEHTNKLDKKFAFTKNFMKMLIKK